VLVLIQARSDSVRLPKKVLRNLYGQPMLQWVVRRTADAASADKVIVATSVSPNDDAIELFCRSESIRYSRGPLENVAKRLMDVAKQERESAFVRISGDSPVIDPAILDLAVRIYQSRTCDLVTNVFPRTFPRGQSVEVINLATMENAFNQSTDKEDAEHVTQFYYKNPEKFEIVNFTSGEDRGKVQLSVDTEADFLSMEKILTACKGCPGGWQELAALKKELSNG
jgi:spore coat polysaccharide biosynthesis protein SpsF